MGVSRSPIILWLFSHVWNEVINNSIPLFSFCLFFGAEVLMAGCERRIRDWTPTVLNPGYKTTRVRNCYCHDWSWNFLFVPSGGRRGLCARLCAKQIGCVPRLCARDLLRFVLGFAARAFWGLRTLPFIARSLRVDLPCSVKSFLTSKSVYVAVFSTLNPSSIARQHYILHRLWQYKWLFTLARLHATLLSLRDLIGELLYSSLVYYKLYEELLLRRCTLPVWPQATCLLDSSEPSLLWEIIYTYIWHLRHQHLFQPDSLTNLLIVMVIVPISVIFLFYLLIKVLKLVH